jgi:hypothetical protein
MLSDVDRILTGLWRLLRSLRVVSPHGDCRHEKQDCSLVSACMEERDCVCGKHENPPNDLPAGVGGAGLGELLTCFIAVKYCPVCMICTTFTAYTYLQSRVPTNSRVSRGQHCR